jgi:hypothetical protein
VANPIESFSDYYVRHEGTVAGFTLAGSGLVAENLQRGDAGVLPIVVGAIVGGVSSLVDYYNNVASEVLNPEDNSRLTHLTEESSPAT